ncbi:TetR/AcrR family transcriptional regulator [Gynurincola endophyticus]|jgi:AcrR family transcriptional regulator|uniref:TetR/AcrR family transcriptional regulator n=1 Tax=Gynurincola endophyticus TaxID=2479004 RepID=UPI000F8DBB82|nr:TetR/AcrR family transcriptional regulator [Gynurincola endophyticus]
MSNCQRFLDPIRNEIVNAAMDLMARFGYRKTTMDDIAKKVGKSKSSLYYYYKTKEEIFEVALQLDTEEQIDALKEVIAAGNTVEEKFHGVVTSLMRKIITHTKSFPHLKQDFIENPLFFIEMSRKKEKQLEVILKDLLILGISTGEVELMSAAEMDMWSKSVISSLQAVGAKLFFAEDFEPTEDNLRFFTRTLFRGIAKM